MIKLKNIRMRIGFSQMEVAQKLNLPISTYNQYETGKNEPNIETLCKLADFYHCSLDDIVGRETDLINLSSMQPVKKSLIQDIISMNELQKMKAQSYFDGLFGR